MGNLLLFLCTKAWYSASAQLNISAGKDDVTSLVTVEANATELTYGVKVVPVITPVSVAGIKADTSKDIYLSAWNDGETALITKVKQNGAAVQDANFTEGTTGVLYRLYRISYYLDVSHALDGNTQKTAEELAALIAADTSTVTFDFTYLKTKDDAVATEIDITAAHLPFYLDESLTDGSPTYMSYANETAGSPDKSFTTKQIKQMSQNSAAADYAGYLYLRIDGENWTHDHLTTNTYKGGVQVAEHV